MIFYFLKKVKKVFMAQTQRLGFFIDKSFG